MNTNSLKILSHNAYWFQGHPFPDSQPGDPNPAVLEGLAALYAEYSPDVICLQEVQSETSFDQAQMSLRLEGAYCPGAHRVHYGGAMFWHHGRYVCDSRNAAPPPQRMWQIAEAHWGNGAHLPIASVHLTSARHMDEAEASCTRVQDLGQVLSQSPKPLVIAGDFNEGPSGSASAYLAHHGYTDVATLVPRAPASTGVNKSRSDQIWLAERLLSAFRGFGVVDWGELRVEVPNMETLSDHSLLWLELDLAELDRLVPG